VSPPNRQSVMFIAAFGNIADRVDDIADQAGDEAIDAETFVVLLSALFVVALC
jgi:hypothetical protein